MKALMIFVILLYSLVASFGAFAGGVWGIAGLVGAILLFVAVRVMDSRLPMPDQNMLRLAVGTLMLMLLNALLSTQPELSWFDWRRLAGVFLPCILFSSPQIVVRLSASEYKRYLFPIVSVTAALGAAALGFELFSGGALLHLVKGKQAALTEYNRGLSYLVLLAFPILAWLWVSGKRRLIIPFILILLIPASLTESRAAKLALIVGLAVTALTFFTPIWTRRGLMVFTFLASGWAFAARAFFLLKPEWVKQLPDSWQERIEIWDFMSYRIMEHPLLGWGLGTSKKLDPTMPHGALYMFVHGAEPHPHNVMTQLWVEMGLPGLAVGILFAGLMLRKAGRLDAALAPFATGAWAAAFCLTLVAYNFWTDSLFATFALVAFAFSLLARTSQSSV